MADSIHFGCPQCQARHEADASLAETEFRCTNCYYRFPVPKKSTLKADEIRDFYAAMPENAQARRAAVVAVCPLCHTTIPGYEEEIGTRKICPECGTAVEIREADRKRLRMQDGISTMSTAGTDPENIYGLNHISPPPVPGAYENDFRKRHTGRIPVVCSLCKTLIHATPEQLGTEIVCPDCGRTVEVKLPEEKDHAEFQQRMAELGTYGVQGAGASPVSLEKGRGETRFSQPCKLCGTLISAVKADIGTELVCPDCETKNFILPPVKKSEKSAADAVSLAHAAVVGYTLGAVGASVEEVAVKPVPQIKLKCALCGELQRVPETEMTALLAGRVKCVECARALDRASILREMKTPLEAEAGPELAVAEVGPRENLAAKKKFQDVFRELFAKKPEKPLREQLDEYGVNAPAVLGEEPVRREVLAWSVPKFFTVGVLDVLGQWRLVVAGCVLAGMLFGLCMLLALMGASSSETETQLGAEANQHMALYYLGFFGLMVAGPPVLMFGSSLCFRVLLRTASGFDPVIIAWKQLTDFHFENLMLLVVVFLVYVFLPGFMVLMLLTQFAVPGWVVLVAVGTAAVFFFPQTLRSVLVNGFRVETPESGLAVYVLSPVWCALAIVLRMAVVYMFVGDPFDRKVWRDLRLFPVRWAVFYVLSFLMLVAGVAAFAGMMHVTAYPLIFPYLLVIVFLTLLYFRLLGRVWFYSDETRQGDERL